jgi:DNA-3-methyladenine glycosylase
MLPAKPDALPEGSLVPGGRIRSREFFSTDAATLARRLIGVLLVRRMPDGARRMGRIVETEAYLGIKDRASHAFGGRRTPRNESMYACPGTAYVYFTYGMHHCFNIVCGELDEPAAVLVRALEPVDWPTPSVPSGQGGGQDLVPRPPGVTTSPSRSASLAHAGTKLMSGPGKLCRELRLDRSMDGADLVSGRSGVWLELPTQPLLARRLGRSPRIGLGECGVWAGRLLRWFELENPCVSGPKAIARSGRVHSEPKKDR